MLRVLRRALDVHAMRAVGVPCLRAAGRNRQKMRTFEGVLRWCAATLLACGLPLASVSAQPSQLIDGRMPPPTTGDGASGDNFGIASAVDGDYVVIGAYGDTSPAAGFTFGVAQGSASVFQRDGTGWAMRQKLWPEPLGADGDNFGVSLAAAGDLLAIGAPRRRVSAAAEAGSVFIFQRTDRGYQQRQLLAAQIPSEGERFGAAVALWQDQLAVGVPAADAVDLYRHVGGGSFEFRRTLIAPGGGVGARFGAALAMADGELLIGAPNADGTGAVYSSRLDGAVWNDAVRVPLAAAPQSELGAALAIDNGIALVGAPGSGAGTVWVLADDGIAWSSVGTMPAPGLTPGDRFGNALALHSQRAVVAAVGANGAEGLLLVYARSGTQFTEIDRIEMLDGGNADRLGASVSLTPDGLLAGADLDQVGPNRGQGAVHWMQQQGAEYVAVARLDNGDGAMFDRFATTVAVDGDMAVAGAYVEDTLAGADAGAAHWYRRVAGGWVHGGRLVAPDGEIEDRFGIAVDISGDWMAFGAYWDVVNGNVDQGSAYLFRRQGDDWVFDTKLTDITGNPGDYFGFALALDGDTLAIGARGDSDISLEQGAVHIFVRQDAGWAAQARIDPPTVNGLGYFGASVAIDGDRMLVGAPGMTIAPGPVAAGAAYVYERTGTAWQLAGVLQAPQPASNAAYGFAVASDRERLLVGAFQDGVQARGAAYVHRADTLALDGELRATLGQPGELAGISVALAGPRAYLGASGFDRNGANGSGRVLVFERGAAGWHETAQWFAVDAADGDGFGRALAADASGNVVIGAPAKGKDNPLEGMAYSVRIDALFQDGFE